MLRFSLSTSRANRAVRTGKGPAFHSFGSPTVPARRGCKTDEPERNCQKGKGEGGDPLQREGGANQRPSTKAEREGGEDERIGPFTTRELAPKDAEERQCDQTDGDGAQPEGGSESASPPEK